MDKPLEFQGNAPLRFLLKGREHSYYIVELMRTGNNNLKVEVAQHRPDGSDANLLTANFEDREDPPYSWIVDATLHVFVGANSPNDKLKIFFHSRDKSNQIIGLSKQYTQETIMEVMGLLEVPYEYSARQDIEEAKQKKIPAVDVMKPLEYHYTHIKIEMEAVKEIPHPYRAYLAQHVEGHQLAIRMLSSREREKH